MLSNPPPVYRKRNELPKRKATLPPVQTVSVVSVQVIDGAAVLWTFSGPVVFSDNQPCPQLRVFVEGQWLGAANVGAWDSPEQIACDYETGELTDGQAWEITQSPSGLDFSPATLALPQSGVVQGGAVAANR